MDLNEALTYVEPHLKKARFDHTIRVVETAVQLTGLHGGNKKKAELAGAFHDYAKYRPTEELKRWILKENLPKDLLSFHYELWHGPVGSILVEREYGITDAEIKFAIRYHTTGRDNMSQLEKMIFLADYIEPGRNFPGVDKVREVAQTNLNEACLMALQNTIPFLMSKNQRIYPDTFYAYNFFMKLHDHEQEERGNG
ncbi:bis(5'-nucleosyl)-tetraphosphatase (symmetrical) YqeK [Terrihalobacillus insolitus]|uniref:bis(5'-nucleosyl)-tetraphosphatase (symmetrical) YqeK n=1 Tax=Terrihalobacillus insolitus TaxID=2950438 RepID=UPI00234167EA|nr:bis(5'-nucleosyl)-tetraphosphatase (symmetrical) YqeK [Terrihalobacillus insolitus]MDC3413318.1 bis(5'-nucleosyl)-tetraphosphatase (symmetrical) YqeK [Terrihalobacillus insolitus]